MAWRCRLLLFLFANSGILVSCWGPFTHQYMGSTNEDRGNSSSFLAGCSAPDAFKFTEESLHSLQFAVYLFEAAKSDSADAIDFALGWGCHLIQDLISHHPRGFLNPKHDHPLEFAADSYVWKNGFQKLPYQKTSIKLQSLVAKASKLASAASAEFKQAVNVSAITDSQAENAVEKFNALTYAEIVAMTANVVYKTEMRHWSFCPVTSFEDVIKNFELSVSWSDQICYKWQESMLNSKNSSQRMNAVDRASDLIEKLYISNAGAACVSPHLLMI
eukprot:TRINITY_DN23295_c0_g1_i1.p1 TRINITY_DN23295_c0_g1~~TRINITY_DN23295_c0_g1_i1.p1  ORF type:complete len:274 (+),score=42.39 TRINITY_DN23295_c0_g1_i1:38-859(+)